MPEFLILRNVIGWNATKNERETQISFQNNYFGSEMFLFQVEKLTPSQVCRYHAALNNL